MSRLCIEERFENLSHKYGGASEFIHLYGIIESLRRSCSLTGSHPIWCSAGVMWSNLDKNLNLNLNLARRQYSSDVCVRIFVEFSSTSVNANSFPW